MPEQICLPVMSKPRATQIRLNRRISLYQIINRVKKVQAGNTECFDHLIHIFWYRQVDVLKAAMVGTLVANIMQHGDPVRQS